MNYDNKDGIYPKIKITSANNNIRWRAGATYYNVAIDVGEYYAYLANTESAAFQAKWPSLFTEVLSKLNAINNTYQIVVMTPEIGPPFVNSSIRIIRTVGSTGPWGFVCNDGTMTFDPRFFGFNDTTLPATTQTSGANVTGIYTRFGMWLSPKQRSSRLGSTANIQFSNAGTYKIRQTVKWHTDKFRLLKYNWVFANHVSKFRNNDASYAAAGYQPLGINDHGNYYMEYWELLSHGDDAIVVYNNAYSNLSITDHQYEIFTLARDFCESSEKVQSIADSNGEIYNLQLMIWRFLYEDFAKIVSISTSDKANYLRED